MEMRAKAAALLAPGGSGGEPSGEQLAALNRFALAKLAAGEAYARQARLANDAVDRTGERLPLSYLERFAATLPGKPLLLSHDHAAPPAGLWFDATVRQSLPGEPGEWTLEAWFYLRKTPANEELRRQIDAGVVRSVSIGFRYDGMTCDLCGAAAFPGGVCAAGHRPGQSYDGQPATFTYGGDPALVEAHEGSLVYLGAQYGAEVEKAVAECSECGARSAECGMGNRPDPSDTPHSAFPTPRSEHSALIEDGLAYRAALRTELTRLAGIARAEAEADLLTAALAGQAAAKWLPVIDSFRARVDALLPPHPFAATTTRAPEPEAPPRVTRPVRLG